MDFNSNDLLERALNRAFLTAEEGIFLLENAATADLMYVGNALRQFHVPNNTVTWIIDRNSNTTNVCIANCKFCNFYRKPGHEESYICLLYTFDGLEPFYRQKGTRTGYGQIFRICRQCAITFSSFIGFSVVFTR